MLLFITLPDVSRFDAESRVRWTLCDPTGDKPGDKLRIGEGLLADAPRGIEVIVLIPASRVVFIETLLPAVSIAKRDQLVRYAIEDKLTIDPSTVHAVVLESDMASRQGVRRDKNVNIVAAIDRAWFSAALQWLSRAGLSPRACFAETALLPVVKGEWSVKLAPDNAYAKRSDGLAYAIDVGSIAEPPFALTLALGEVTEKPSALSLFLADPRSSDQSAATIRWQAALGLPVRFSALNDATDALAFKQLATLKSGNLLTGEFAPIRAASAWASRLAPALMLLGVITCIQIAAVVADSWRLDRQRQAIENDMRTTFQSAFPKATAIIDPPLQMQRNLDTLKRERGLLREDDSRLTLARFAALREAAPELSVIEVRIKKGDAKMVAKFDPAAGGSNAGAAIQALQARISPALAASITPGKQPGTVEIALKDIATK